MNEIKVNGFGDLSVNYELPEGSIIDSKTFGDIVMKMIDSVTNAEITRSNNRRDEAIALTNKRYDEAIAKNNNWHKSIRYGLDKFTEALKFANEFYDETPLEDLENDKYSESHLDLAAGCFN